MKKISSLLSVFLLSLSLFAQSLPDSDGDGISDAEDLCPSLKGTKARKGCPEENKQQPVFITAGNLENILIGICKNTLQEKVTGKITMNRVHITRLPYTGAANNLPVYYQQVSPLNYQVLIGLSESLADSTEALRFINEALKKTNTCNGLFRDINLYYNATGKHYTDVAANDQGGVFFYLEKAKPAGKLILQLRISRINYPGVQPKEKTPVPAPEKPVNTCADLQTILDACINGFSNSKGSFVKQETPAKYYSTSLPDLGLTEKFVVESMNVDVVNEQWTRKAVIYYNASQQFSDKAAAVQLYEQLRDRLKKCYSGAANVSDEKNQKIYEFFFDYKGYKIRAAVIWLSFFGTDVSISIRIAD